MEIDDLKLLHLVARQGSFAAAARVIGVDPSAVSRSVAGVEAALGLRVFQRSTRRLSVTEEGAVLLDRSGPLLDDLDQALDQARSTRRAPSGRLRMTASVAFGEVRILPHLAAFRDLYPEIALELVLSDANVDLLADGVDLAVRLAPAPKGDFITTRLCGTRYHLCAAPAYLDRHPAPATPQDLIHHDCLRMTRPYHTAQWLFRDNGDAVTEVAVSGSLTISNALALRSAARRGLGPALLADWLVADDLAAGDLVDLFPDHRPTASGFETAAWLLYPSRSYLPAKTRAMVDFLKSRLGAAAVTKVSPL